jgi:hypothetical protein
LPLTLSLPRPSPRPPPALLQEEFVAAFQQLATRALSQSSRRQGRPSNLHEFFVYDYGPDLALCRWVFSRHGQGAVDEKVWGREGGRGGGGGGKKGGRKGRREKGRKRGREG